MEPLDILEGRLVSSERPRAEVASGVSHEEVNHGTAAHMFPALSLCAVLATFFTNLEPVPICTVLAPFCMLVLAEKTTQLSCFVAILLSMGLVCGISAYGYLFEFSFLLGVLLQLPQCVAYIAHRIICHRHPDSFLSVLAFPCLHTSVFVLVMYFMPIGSVPNPAYSATSLTFVVQIAAFSGRNGVTFLLNWAAACLARVMSAGFQHKSAKRSLFLFLLVWLLLVLLGALRFYSPHLFLDIRYWDGAVAEDNHQVSCLSGFVDMYEQTQKRLAVGDTIVIHSERATSSWYGSNATISSYVNLLQDSHGKNGIEAVVVLSFVGEGKSWYHLVSRNGDLMSYAKIHPVPFVEDDVVGGDFQPLVVGVPLGRPSGSVDPVSITGTICFDTDFPWVTRRLSGADLFLETSQTWFNIGEQHFQGHKFTAIENGATLIKCTQDGVTGAFDAYGNVLFHSPQTSGVTIFSVPRLQRVLAFPAGGFAFDIVVCFASIFWVILCSSPTFSRPILSAV